MWQKKRRADKIDGIAQGKKITFDSDGNIIIVSDIINDIYSSILVLKYSADGEKMWESNYTKYPTSQQNEVATAIHSDILDKVYVSGIQGSTATDAEYITFKLNKFDRNITYDFDSCLLYTSPSPRDATLSRMPSSA